MTTTVGDPASAVPSRRERARQATLTEIKATALDLMRSQGNTDVRFADIARAMGFTAQALYRYYGDRDQLLTDLIFEGYHDLAQSLADAVTDADPSPGREHFRVVATAYRAWALGDPPRFTLLFGQPVPGYVAPAHGPTVEAAKSAIEQLALVVHRALAAGVLADPIVEDVAPSTLAALQADADDSVVEGTVPAASHQALLHAWYGMHGAICLEMYGHLRMYDKPALDAIYEAQVELSSRAMGLADT
ncbi:MAG TPA: TetR/AcrR family transcriptional regulator [Actinomycetes bacterium]